ncbi:MAG TPA: serine protease [Streptosporangiaceae bacterium]|nr:serine protease [Streptosporangiaceae bacterium]
MRAGRLAGRHLAARGLSSRPGAGGQDTTDGRGRGVRRWFTRPPAVGALVAALTVGVVVVVAPATGAAGGIAAGLARAVHHLVSPSRNGEAFPGTPAVGALFTTNAGTLASHFCTASVIDSPPGDLVVTAAHCVSGDPPRTSIAFVPGYHDGKAPYGVWAVTKVYVDQAWAASADPDDDVAILRVSQPGSSVPIQDVTGADKLATGTPARQLVQVIGYPDGGSEPITCQNWTKHPMADQIEFDCGGYTDGTSGGPFLAGVSVSTGQGTVIGVIGGYEQGGDVPQVSYSAMFGANVAALYQAAVAGG